MGRLIPDGWMPECRMARVITHWTAGAYTASDVDREHYHVLIEGDGRPVRGDCSIRDNVFTRDGDYAAHTRGLNSGSIGITLCCMGGAMRQPFRPGDFPLRREQYEALALAVADLCRRYQIPVTPQTVLGHGEVEAILGVAQRGKWDPMVLPWEPGRPLREVGDAFRDRICALLVDRRGPGALPPLTVIVNERVVSEEGILQDGASWAPLRPLAEHLGWTILSIDPRLARVATPIGPVPIAAMIRGDRGYVHLRELCARLGFPPPIFDAAACAVRVVAVAHR